VANLPVFAQAKTARISAVLAETSRPGLPIMDINSSREAPISECRRTGRRQLALPQLERHFDPVAARDAHRTDLRFSRALD
jgi:hypothetical protein